MNKFEQHCYDMLMNKHKEDIEAKILQKALKNYDIRTERISLKPEEVRGYMKQRRYQITYISKHTGLDSYTASFLLEDNR